MNTERPTAKRLTASEREALLRLNVAMEILILDLKPLQERAKTVPYAKRDMAMMARKAEKLLGAFAKTIPDAQLMTYRRSLEMVSYVVGVKKPGAQVRDEKNYGLWLPWEVLNALLAGCHAHCMMCALDKAQRRACPLMKALNAIPNDTRDREDGDCPYYTLL